MNGRHFDDGKLDASGWKTGISRCVGTIDGFTLITSFIRLGNAHAVNVENIRETSK